MNDSSNIADSLAAAGIRCYEFFRDGNMAFEREAELYFGPIAKVSAFLSGSNETFLTGEAAKAKIAELRTQQEESRYRSTTTGSDNDSLAQTRRWESERNQWAPEYVREQLEALR
jgi:hypothetical protein